MALECGRERHEPMQPMILSAVRVLTCRRGSTLVGYSSLALLAAIAAITLVTKADVDAGADSHRRAIGTISSD
ncbi:MAG: hypothetical protein HYX38_24975 [Rhodospirillales bacterium]|nr:hypothetical protein [Rhodospirillales bacterium]